MLLKTLLIIALVLLPFIIIKVGIKIVEHLENIDEDFWNGEQNEKEH